MDELIKEIRTDKRVAFKSEIQECKSYNQYLKFQNQGSNKIQKILLEVSKEIKNISAEQL